MFRSSSASDTNLTRRMPSSQRVSRAGIKAMLRRHILLLDPFRRLRMAIYVHNEIDSPLAAIRDSFAGFSLMEPVRSGSGVPCAHVNAPRKALEAQLECSRVLRPAASSTLHTLIWLPENRLCFPSHHLPLRPAPAFVVISQGEPSLTLPSAVNNAPWTIRFRAIPRI